MDLEAGEHHEERSGEPRHAGPRINPARLRKQREAAMLYQRELAERAGLSEAAVSALEGGQRGGNLETIRKLAAALQLEPGAIADFPDSDPPP